MKSETSLDFNKLINQLSMGQNEINTASDQSVVVVIGNTGVGKSTLIRYLTRKDLISYTKRRKTYFKPSDESSGPIISDSRGKSETIFPCCYKLSCASDEFSEESTKLDKIELSEDISSENNIDFLDDSNKLDFVKPHSPEAHKSSKSKYDFLLQDTAGFYDDRDLHTRVLISVAHEMARRKAKNIKSVVLVIDIAELDVARSAGIKKLIQILSKNFVSFKEVLPSVQFVFSKTDEISKEDVIGDIRQLLEEYNSTLKENKKIFEQQKKKNTSIEPDEYLVDLSAQVIFLQHIINNESNVFVTKYNDETDTLRDSILNAIAICPEIDKKWIRSDNYSEENACFNEALSRQSVSAIKALQDAKKLQIAREDIDQEIQALEENINELEQFAKASFTKQQQIIHSIKNPELNFEKNTQKIKDLQKRISELQAKIKEYTSTEKEMFFRLDANETLEWWQILSWVRHTFKSEGLVYSSVEEVVKNGKIETRVDNSADGKYEAIYTSGWYTNAAATIKFYREKRLNPAYIAYADSSRSEIEKLERDIVELEKDNIKSKTEMEQWQHSKSPEHEIIANTSSQMRQRLVDLGLQRTELIDAIRETQKEIEEQKSIYQWCKDLIVLYKFSNPIYDEFLQLFEQYSNRNFKSERNGFKNQPKASSKGELSQSSLFRPKYLDLSTLRDTRSSLKALSSYSRLNDDALKETENRFKAQYREKLKDLWMLKQHLDQIKEEKASRYNKNTGAEKTECRKQDQNSFSAKI